MVKLKNKLFLIAFVCVFSLSDVIASNDSIHISCSVKT